MPHKHNAARRHHIPKMRHQVLNWPEYEAGLRRRGSLTLWITEDALNQWTAVTRTTPGGQRRYADGAIQTCLMLRTVFKLALRQAEGFMRSVLELMGVDIAVPDHSTVSRRAATLAVIVPVLPAGPVSVLIDSTGVQIYGAGEWQQEKHGKRARRTWRKLHLAVDATSGQIVASTLTEASADDPSQVGPLLEQIAAEIMQVTADGAYDGEPTYGVIAQRGADIVVAIPPRSTAVASESADTAPTQRDAHLAMIKTQGRLAWQSAMNYGRRALVETTMGRYKALIGTRLRARDLPAQQTEAAIGVAVLNRMLAAARPNSVRCKVEPA
jgi:transposase